MFIKQYYLYSQCVMLKMLFKFFIVIKLAKHTFKRYKNHGDRLYLQRVFSKWQLLFIESLKIYA
jgi:hypothetical protein